VVFLKTLKLDIGQRWLHNAFVLKSTEVIKMATVTVKNMPDEVYMRLKLVAEKNRRSINSEIIVCIENAVTSRRINPDEMLENARRLRQLTAGNLISNDEFNLAKAEGRL
jgi:plasmid stability protein